MQMRSASLSLILCFTGLISSAEQRPSRLYKCVENQCLEQDLFSKQGSSIGICKLTCGPFGSLWPKPQKATLSRETVPIYAPDRFSTGDGPSKKLANAMFEVFQNTWTKQYGKKIATPENTWRGMKIVAEISTFVEKVRLSTEESYQLEIQCDESPSNVSVKITSSTVFGFRHGLETLSQLMAYDYVTRSVHVMCGVSVKDWPSFKYRGLLVDTSRHFVPIPALKRVIDGLSNSKMNRFHWHIVDSTSFPLEIKSIPYMHIYGAYYPDQIYTQSEVKELINYALLRGIAVVPELDAPGHVGRGWEWGPKSGKGDLALCADMRCIGVPCGTLNPINPAVYKTLQQLYKEMQGLFESDLFHMGGDEVKFKCWKNQTAILSWLKNHNLKKDDHGMHKLWDHFQRSAFSKLTENSSDLLAVLWTSTLTNDYANYLESNRDRYVIQVWDNVEDKVLPDLVSKEFKVIASFSDALYLDCGFGNWAMEGPNWCSPYHDWPRIYNTRPYRSYSGSWEIKDTKHRKLILGAEAAMWGEEMDEQVIETKVFPRVDAMAERLWTDPDDCWIEANERMLIHRERLTDRGLRADALLPHWCLQNPGACQFTPEEWEKNFDILSTCPEYYWMHRTVFDRAEDYIKRHFWLALVVGILLILLVGTIVRHRCRPFGSIVGRVNGHRGYSVVPVSDSKMRD